MFDAFSVGAFRDARERWERRMGKAVTSAMGLPAPAIRSTGTPMPILPAAFGPSPGRGMFSTMAGWINSISADIWFTPGQPVAPQAPPQTQPRSFDYPVGINIMYVPRSEEDLTFAQLRSLADLWDLLRLVIETRKDQICAVEWSVRPVRDVGEPTKDFQNRARTDDTAADIKEKLQKPDGELDWRTWLRKFMEDQLVIDAVAVLPDPETKRLEIMDGATIKRLIDNRGRTPRPADGVAYQQVIKGVPAVDFVSGQGGDPRFQPLYYFRRNVRAHKIYGMSPVEQCAWTINLAIRRALYKISYYTEGNMPEAFIQVPEEWGLDQVRTFAEWFDSLLAGQVDRRRRAFFIPGVSGRDPVIFPKQDMLKDEMDEWLVRIACYCVGVSPDGFIRQMNRATAQTSQEASRAEGLAPVLRWVESCMTTLIQEPMGFPGYEFVFESAAEFDLLKKAQRQSLQVRNALRSPNELREENGDDPVDGGDTPGIVTATGFAPLGSDMTTGDAPDPAPGFGSQDGKQMPSAGNGKGATGAGQKGGDVQKVTSADAWRTRRGKQRVKREQKMIERFLARMGQSAARAIEPAYRRQTGMTKGRLMDELTGYLQDVEVGGNGNGGSHDE
jgi:portal protein